jgi:hypothetical protein
MDRIPDAPNLPRLAPDRLLAPLALFSSIVFKFGTAAGRSLPFSPSGRLAKDLLRTTKDLFASARSGLVVATYLSILQDTLLRVAEPEGVASMDRWTPTAAGCATFAPRLVIATAIRRRRKVHLLEEKPVSLDVEASARRFGAG